MKYTICLTILLTACGSSIDDPQSGSGSGGGASAEDGGGGAGGSAPACESIGICDEQPATTHPLTAWACGHKPADACEPRAGHSGEWCCAS